MRKSSKGRKGKKAASFLRRKEVRNRVTRVGVETGNLTIKRRTGACQETVRSIARKKYWREHTVPEDRRLLWGGHH